MALQCRAGKRGYQMGLKRQLIVAIAIAVLAAAQQQSEIDEAQKQIKAAQEKSDWAGVVQAATSAGSLLAKAIAAPKPESMSDEAWKNTQERLRAERVQAEYACLDASNKETDPAKRVKLLEQFTTAFEGGDYAKRSLPTLAGLYQQTGNTPKALAMAKAALEVDPNNEGLHLMLADSDLARKQLPSALEHARAAVKILETKKMPEGYTDDSLAKYTKIIGGSAHSIAGQALMQQEKSEAAIPELKSASELLAGNQQALGAVLYNLAFAYAKLRRAPEARAVLAKAVLIPGPFQQLSKDLLVAQTPKPK
jgi:tetratricopeptide (TPR) repeat protein